MRALILGAGGLLGTAFRDALRDHGPLVAGRERLEVNRPGEVKSLIRESGAELVINCAAHTDVDAAERDPDPAFAANSILPGLVAGACRRAGSTLLHISSTGCYGRLKSTPYTEEDDPRPTTAHHRSKLSGEEAVRQSGCEFLILRTGWLFGGSAAQKKNFVWQRLLEARSRAAMVSDPHQHGNPTFVDDVAARALALVRGEIAGTYNLAAGPGASRFEYVAEIVRSSGLPCTVEPSPTPFSRAAPVSPNEMATNYRLGLMGLDGMPPWKSSLGRFVTDLMRSPEWARLPRGIQEP